MQPANLISPALPGVSYIQFKALQDYQIIYDKMRAFTLQRDTTTQDEVWLLEHFPVFTQGQAGKADHMIRPSSIPLIQSDRGGQITYHGPGQIMIYGLLDLTRRHWNSRSLLNALEAALIALLAQYGIEGYTQPQAPGIYVKGAKIASVGFRIRKGCSYHGACLNVRGDLTPFENINPCGYKNLLMTKMTHFVPTLSIQEIYMSLITLLKAALPS